ncbi:MAG: SUMF1/EgtB/PvdO family nonheme iron enzyme [Nitrospina sp.]|jgi:formylglycine-generating enzyme required for sulfatase activity|nr:SUMF1/EgtB/PvdO family nonheme iron enzyme [Nitrospina sp.]MBT5633080.1 SUMF1/EgtB/PvdO family nonheme iron enzyme [Nitrospina sp.]MBT6248398.1 SUMF1/EgtB/PvdO family nonheme iron enzyme [Nitrospina sp.]
MKTFILFVCLVLASESKYAYSSEMVEVPAGKSVIGEISNNDALPQQVLQLQTFSIDRFEVTQEEYARFFPEFIFWQGAEAHPATNITWYQAQSYCEQVGKRLPTEQEWEKSARGTDARLYPWGDKPPRKKPHPFYSGIIKRRVGLNKKDNSPYGVRDMAGSVWEWTASFENGKNVTRGGLWNHHLDYEYSKTFERNLIAPSGRFIFLGFRCAK